LAMRSCESFSIHDSFTHPTLRKKVRNSIPIILDGSFIPVAQTTNSPNAKHPKMTKNCIAM